VFSTSQYPSAYLSNAWNTLQAHKYTIKPYRSDHSCCRQTRDREAVPSDSFPPLCSSVRVHLEPQCSTINEQHDLKGEQRVSLRNRTQKRPQTSCYVVPECALPRRARHCRTTFSWLPGTFSSASMLPRSRRVMKRATKAKRTRTALRTFGWRSRPTNEGVLLAMADGDCEQ